jgi:toxin-antitoxin system PIN domain toxin
VKLVDANVLLYADNQDAEHHGASNGWLTQALSGIETLIVPWLNVVSYLRISTNPAYHRDPNSLGQSLDFIRTVLSAPTVIAGEPDSQHLDRMSELLAATGRGGNLINDAHLAALALQYDATVITYDNDFGRFPGVRWERPSR